MNYENLIFLAGFFAAAPVAVWILKAVYSEPEKKKPSSDDKG